MSFSVAIASRGPAIGLWMTICAVEQAMTEPVTYHVCLNGTEFDGAHQVMQNYLGDRLTLLESDVPLPPPIARNRAAGTAKGDYLLFLDDHCLVDPYLFRRAELLDKPILHTSYTTCAGNAPRYYHFFGIDSMVKGDYATAPHRNEPYQCASGPHGCFVVKRDTWDYLGGYWDDYVGFGGEEASFDLYAWSKGVDVWMEPNLMTYHFSARAHHRGYSKDINPDNYDMAIRKLAPCLPMLKAKFIEEKIPH